MKLDSARQALQQGHYSVDVLHAFAHQWQQRQSFRSWLDYMIAKRQFGYPLSACHLQRALTWHRQSRLQRWSKGIYRHKARQLLNLIAEAQHNVEMTPAVMPPYQSLVQAWRKQQNQHYQALVEELSNSRVIVVGNSPTLAGQKLGAQIDQHDVVIRFNQFSSEHTATVDIGQKLTIWVMAPGYDGPVPDAVDWIIIAGPQMLWWQQQWPQLINHRGAVLGVPLQSWRASVQQLHAPPSAGFLIIQWLRSFMPFKQLSITGFGIKPKLPYHHAIKGHQAVTRHNWPAEHQQLNKWIQQHPL